MRRVHAVADGTPDSVEHDLSVMPGRVRRSLLNQLAEGERIIIRTRQSPQVLLLDLGWPLGALLVWWFLVVEAQVSTALSDIALVALLVALARLGWKEVERRHSWFVATNKRVLKHSGVITHKVPMMLLRKVTDMTYRRSLLGQIGGYGTIVFESAGQKQAIRELTFIPDPDAVTQALNAEIFGDRPRARRGDRDRSWPRMPKRPRRGRDDGPDEGPGGGGRPHGGGPRSDPDTGGVDVSPSGHPAPPRVEPETWYRSSTLRGPSRLGDTGEIPVVSADEADAWLRARHDEEDGSGPDGWAEARELRRDTTTSHSGDAAREIPLYPPREWVERD